MDFVRARQPEQKNQRLDSILSAAGSLFESSEFEQVSMREIAREAGLGKASLYHYFSTKEEVFFELFLRDIDLWVDDFEARMSRLRKPSREKIAAIIAKLMIDHPRCSKLLAILSAVLERNIGAEKLREFKTSLLDPMSRMREILQRRLPDLSTKRTQEFLVHFHVIITGLWPIANPNADLTEALSVPHLEALKIDFETHCRTLVLKLLAD